MISNGYMDLALEEARAAAARGEVPVGAVIVRDGTVVARAGNRTRELNVTLEPCTMCAAAISFARLRRLYYGTDDEKGGAVTSGVRFFHQPTCHHSPDVYPGMASSDAMRLLKDFFKDRR